MLSFTFIPLVLNVVMLSVVAPSKVLLKGAPLRQTPSFLANIRLGFKKLPGTNALVIFSINNKERVATTLTTGTNVVKHTI